VPLGVEAEAFAQGRLGEVWGYDDLSAAPWLAVHVLAHGSLDELERQAGAPTACDRAAGPGSWPATSARLARTLLDVAAHDPDRLRRAQRLLWSLEDELVDAQGHVDVRAGEVARLVRGALAPLMQPPAEADEIGC
jgi:hypothetical protein